VCSSRVECSIFHVDWLGMYMWSSCVEVCMCGVHVCMYVCAEFMRGVQPISCRLVRYVHVQFMWGGMYMCSATSRRLYV